jgi:ATP-dependent DNA helicase DinG
MGLEFAVSDAFAVTGPLARAVDNFKPRNGQIAMAQAVAQTMEQGGALVVEAGTGVGKTYAYLVPALLSGERVLLSTATKALQDQLLTRDIPHLLSALGLPVRVALLKGRSSYLCMHRLASARADARIKTLKSIRELAQIEVWAGNTRTGDLAELSTIAEDSLVTPLVTSTRDNCLGRQCPQLARCHVNLARREAMVADLVVVNHHLFFADMRVRESGVAELLPSVTTVVFDEAHQLNEIGAQFLGQVVTTAQLVDFGRDLAAQTTRWAPGVAPWALMVLDWERSLEALRKLTRRHPVNERCSWGNLGPIGIEEHDWQNAVYVLLDGLHAFQKALEMPSQASPDIETLSERAAVLADRLKIFVQPLSEGFVRWLEVGSSLRMIEAPLSISQAMQAKVLLHGVQSGQRRSWIFTSATLGGDAEMEWFVDSCGLKGARCLQVESPFDYPTQAALYIPGDMPKPNDASHSACVAMLVAQAAEILGGRTLVLTTTLRAMRTIGEALRSYFSQPKSLEVLVQGDAPKRELLERFRNGESDFAKGCVLVASATFWEGVDIPGDALQLLVIDKLPFAPPSDPQVKARATQLASQGKNAFKHLHMPQAAIALKQGAGRLIRSESDRGILVVCDVRLTQMGYGKKLRAALPTMPTLQDPEQFHQALLGLLTKPSTKDPDFS